MRQDRPHVATWSAASAELVAWISNVMTLLPGDVILTGTPAGVGPIVAGDSVSVSIGSIGTLTNRVVLRD